MIRKKGKLTVVHENNKIRQKKNKRRSLRFVCSVQRNIPEDFVEKPKLQKYLFDNMRADRISFNGKNYAIVSQYAEDY